MDNPSGLSPKEKNLGNVIYQRASGAFSYYGGWVGSSEVLHLQVLRNRVRFLADSSPHFSVLVGGQTVHGAWRAPSHTSLQVLEEGV